MPAQQEDLTRPESAEMRRLYAEVFTSFPIPDYLDDVGEGERFIAAQLASLLPERGRLLDLGCGPLDKTSLFARLGFDCYACDDFNDPWHRKGDTLDRIREVARRNRIKLHIHENGDYRIPFEKNSFDAACLLGVVEHLHESPRSILNAAGEMLAPGGILVIVMPNAVNLRKRISVMMGRTNYPDVRGFFHSTGQWRGHVREYTLEETKYVVETAGFLVERAGTFHSMIRDRIGSRFLRGAYRFVTRAFPSLKDSLFVAAKKPRDWMPQEFSEEKFREAVARSVPEGVL